MPSRLKSKKGSEIGGSARKGKGSCRQESGGTARIEPIRLRHGGLTLSTPDRGRGDRPRRKKDSSVRKEKINKRERKKKRELPGAHLYNWTKKEKGSGKGKGARGRGERLFAWGHLRPTMSGLGIFSFRSGHGMGTGRG